LASRSLVSSEEIADPFAVSFEWKPMQIKKLTNSSVLKRGELLIVLKCSKRYPDDVLIDLGKSIESRFEPGKTRAVIKPSRPKSTGPERRIFLYARSRYKGGDQSVTDGWEIIGWDPVRQQIRSWIFDSNGGRLSLTLEYVPQLPRANAVTMVSANGR